MTTIDIFKLELWRNWEFVHGKINNYCKTTLPRSIAFTHTHIKNIVKNTCILVIVFNKFVIGMNLTLNIGKIRYLKIIIFYSFFSQIIDWIYRLLSFILHSLTIYFLFYIYLHFLWIVNIVYSKGLIVNQPV